MSYVRLADQIDLPEILSCCRKFWNSLAYHKRIPFDQRSVLETLEGLLEQRMLFVAEAVGEIVGVVGGVVVPMFMNRSKLGGQELFFWLAPEHRERGLGRQLLRAIEAQAKRLGCVQWSMIAVDHMDGERVGRFYESEGYTRTECTFTKEL